MIKNIKPKVEVKEQPVIIGVIELASVVLTTDFK